MSLQKRGISVGPQAWFDRFMGDLETAETQLTVDEYQGLLRDVVSHAQGLLFIKNTDWDAVKAAAPTAR